MSALTSVAIIEKLYTLGHYNNPACDTGIRKRDIANLTLADKETLIATKSFQEYHAEQLEMFAVSLGKDPSAVIDGDVGPVSSNLFTMDRCGYPDYETAESLAEGIEIAEATGNGSWAHGCDPNRPAAHVISVQIRTDTMPGFLKPIFETQIWPAVVASYAHIGVYFEREDNNNRANIVINWQRLGGSTIGLAIVPGGPMGCGQRIWARFSPTYRPGSNLVDFWIILFLHELGHNMRLPHTRGHIMNPSIKLLKPVKEIWVGSPSFPQLKRQFGGVVTEVDIPDPPTGPGPLPPIQGGEYLTGPINLHNADGTIRKSYDLTPGRVA